MNMLNLIEEKNLILAGQRYGMWISADPICTAVLLNPKVITYEHFLFSKLTGMCVLSTKFYSD